MRLSTNVGLCHHTIHLLSVPVYIPHFTSTDWDNALPQMTDRCKKGYHMLREDLNCSDVTFMCMWDS